MNKAEQFKKALLQRRRGWLQAAGAVGLLSLTCGGGYAWSKSGQAEQAVEALSWDKLIPTGWRPSPHLQLLANKISSLIDDSKIEISVRLLTFETPIFLEKSLMEAAV